jgi:hypothetical protein
MATVRASRTPRASHRPPRSSTAIPTARDDRGYPPTAGAATAARRDHPRDRVRRSCARPVRRRVGPDEMKRAATSIRNRGAWVGWLGSSRPLGRRRPQARTPRTPGLAPWGLRRLSPPPTPATRGQSGRDGGRSESGPTLHRARARPPVPRAGSTPDRLPARDASLTPGPPIAPAAGWG